MSYVLSNQDKIKEELRALKVELKVLEAKVDRYASLSTSRLGIKPVDFKPVKNEFELNLISSKLKEKDFIEKLLTYLKAVYGSSLKLVNLFEKSFLVGFSLNGYLDAKKPLRGLDLYEKVFVPLKSNGNINSKEVEEDVKDELRKLKNNQNKKLSIARKRKSACSLRPT